MIGTSPLYLPEVDRLEQATAFLLRLQGWVERGFCLHGSSRSDLRIIEPRLAIDHVGRPAKSLRAVYAHRADVRIPVLKASAGPRKADRPWALRYQTDPEGKLHIEGENLEFGSGYIYVLPANSFRAVAQEFVSLSPVEVATVETIPHGVVPYMTGTFIEPAAAANS